MTASQLLLPGTTSSRLPRLAAALLLTVAFAVACLPAAASARAAGRVAGVQAIPAPGAPGAPTAHATDARALAAGASLADAPRRRPARAHARPTGAAGPFAHAAGRRCAPARGVLASHRSKLRTRRRLLCLMNRARARFGLPPLRADRCLNRVASRHAHDMVHRRYFAHVTPNGWDPGKRARKSGYVPRSARWVVGENIAWGIAAAARPAWVVRAWLRSPSHRHNLLSRRFRDAGIGVARGTPYRGLKRWRLRATFSVEFGAHGGRTRCDRRR